MKASTLPKLSFSADANSLGMPVLPGPIISQNWLWFQCCEALLNMPFCATAPES